MEDQTENTLRDDILEAANEVEAQEEPTNEEQAAPEEEATEETTEEVSGEAEPVEAAAEEPEKPALNPPVDWSPEVASKWGDLSPDVQSAIVERERHVNQVLQESADSRHAVANFNEMFAPYQPLMQAEGVTDPMQAIGGLLQTTATLMMGTPEQKAQRIAGLINHYGIDISTLDQVLAGEQVVDPAVNQFNQLLDQRLAPINQLMQRVQQVDQQTQEQTRQQAEQTIHQFAADPKNKYFNNVRETMADFVDVARSQGRDMPIEEAYQRACMADPNIAQHYIKELTDAAAQGNQQATNAAMSAASSVAGNPAGGSASMLDEDMSLRETIAAQFAGNDRI